MQWYWSVLGALAYIGVLVLIGSRTSKREFQMVLLAILGGLILAIPFLEAPHNYVVAVFVVIDLAIIIGPSSGHGEQLIADPLPERSERCSPAVGTHVGGRRGGL